jgi:hypothetical protein
VNQPVWRLPSHVNVPRWLCHHALAVPPNPDSSAETSGSTVAELFCFAETQMWLPTSHE